MGKIYQTFLTDAAYATWQNNTAKNSMSPEKRQPERKGSNICICRQCHAHLCLTGDIISKGFHGKHGKAYLVKDVENILMGESEDRLLMTGLHTICDIFCIVCESVLGWKYIYAYEDSQKFKEGACILERARIKTISGQPSERDVVPAFHAPATITTNNNNNNNNDDNDKDNDDDDDDGFMKIDD